MSDIAPHFTMKRMLDDYYDRFYNKLFERNKKIRENDFAMAYELEEWKSEIQAKWYDVKVLSVNLPDSTARPLSLGETFDVELEIDTNGIDPKFIGIEMVIGHKVMDKVNKIDKLVDLDRKTMPDGISKFTCSLDLSESGVYDYAFRIYPKNDQLPHRQDFALARWI